MFKKIDENKPIKITLKDQNNVEIFSDEAANFENAYTILIDWMKEHSTVLPWIKCFQNNGTSIVCNLQTINVTNSKLRNIDVIFSNVNIEFDNVKEKVIISPRGEFPFSDK